MHTLMAFALTRTGSNGAVRVPERQRFGMVSVSSRPSIWCGAPSWAQRGAHMPISQDAQGIRDGYESTHRSCQPSCDLPAKGLAGTLSGLASRQAHRHSRGSAPSRRRKWHLEVASLAEGVQALHHAEKAVLVRPGVWGVDDNSPLLLVVSFRNA